MYSTNIEIWELLLLPIYLMVPAAIIFAYPTGVDRKWFALGMASKIAGALAFAFIYIFYYNGGDTISYYQTALPFLNLILTDPALGIPLLFKPYSLENYTYFTYETGVPLAYIYMEANTFMVSKLIIPFLMVSFKSYLLSTILVASVSFFGPWRLYKLFTELAPDLQKFALFSVLLFPSVLFWGSGISKDTITYASLCYFVYGFYHTFIKRDIKLIRILFTIITAYLIIVVKSYIFLGIFPGMLLWFFFRQVQRIKNKLLKISIIPVVFILSLLVFAFTYSSLSGLLGEYGNTDSLVEKAIVSQEDLKRDYYGSNSFDIGTIEPTMAGVLSKFPIATFYGFFGPTLLHANNVVMLLSALENTMLLLITTLVFVRNPINQIRRILSSPFLIFCFSMSIILAFAIGLSTPNFGALVRFKIPLIPFFFFALIVLYKNKKVNY